MSFPMTENQTLWADAISGLAQRHWTTDHRERSWASDPAAEDELARALVDAGVMGLSSSSEHGGLDQTLHDLTSTYERAGYHALPVWMTRHLIACEFLQQMPDYAAKAASGELLVGLSLNDQHVEHPDRIDALVHLRPNRAELLLGCQFEDIESVDKGRPLGALIDAQQRVEIAHASPQQLFNRAYNAACLTDALQLIGLSQAALDMSVEYASNRHQFGKPIGVQQAVKHQLANAMIALEFARPMVQRAGDAQTQRDAECDGRVSGSWLLATEAARQVERTALQVHGAMGYSFEYPLHHFLKRSWALRYAQSPASDHTERVRTWLMEDENND